MVDYLLLAGVELFTESNAEFLAETLEGLKVLLVLVLGLDLGLDTYSDEPCEFMTVSQSHDKMQGKIWGCAPSKTRTAVGKSLTRRAALRAAERTSTEGTRSLDDYKTENQVDILDTVEFLLESIALQAHQEITANRIEPLLSLFEARSRLVAGSMAGWLGWHTWQRTPRLRNAILITLSLSRTVFQTMIQIIVRLYNLKLYTIVFLYGSEGETRLSSIYIATKVELYVNQAALDKHRAAPYFQDLIKKAPELLGKPLELKVGSELLQESAQVVRV
ncbi:unnamed protein product [Aspergillus oryzae RIB40]|uniref:DNA, SC102 n=1 Tax=Aspergillus oryzae (strain ATCC 42149 / RIB 40) TaxID=510516 RepID=Q2UAG7_ASPOR|nr:unnamed protein product [Aspergillus oryzae RIB40]BAE61448.1 unnamed protein product [Aspergillus oryzae RIB40]